jgi:hypothetical protein
MLRDLRSLQAKRAIESGGGQVLKTTRERASTVILDLDD